jgi:hypothetical protein
VSLYSDEFRGMTIDQAVAYATKLHYARVRVISEDGNHHIVTRDLRSDRINVTLVDGKVVEAWVG